MWKSATTSSSLQAKEKAEIERILRALSARITPEVRSLQNNLDVLAELDFRFAKARLSRQMHAVNRRSTVKGVSASCEAAIR